MRAIYVSRTYGIVSRFLETLDSIGITSPMTYNKNYVGARNIMYVHGKKRRMDGSCRS